MYPNSDKWLEQGGLAQPHADTKTIRLIKSYKDTNYNSMCNIQDSAGNRYAVQIVSRAKNSFIVHNGHSGAIFIWRCSGYIS